jgi:hypothetical protein
MSCGTTAPARMQLKTCRSLKAESNFGLRLQMYWRGAVSGREAQFLSVFVIE